MWEVKICKLQNALIHHKLSLKIFAFCVTGGGGVRGRKEINNRKAEKDGVFISFVCLKNNWKSASAVSKFTQSLVAENTKHGNRNKI